MRYDSALRFRTRVVQIWWFSAIGRRPPHGRFSGKAVRCRNDRIIGYVPSLVQRPRRFFSKQLEEQGAKDRTQASTHKLIDAQSGPRRSARVKKAQEGTASSKTALGNKHATQGRLREEVSEKMVAYREAQMHAFRVHLALSTWLSFHRRNWMDSVYIRRAMDHFQRQQASSLFRVWRFTAERDRIASLQARSTAEGYAVRRSPQEHSVSPATSREMVKLWQRRVPPCRRRKHTAAMVRQWCDSHRRRVALARWREYAYDSTCRLVRRINAHAIVNTSHTWNAFVHWRRRSMAFSKHSSSFAKMSHQASRLHSHWRWWRCSRLKKAMSCWRHFTTNAHIWRDV